MKKLLKNKPFIIFIIATILIFVLLLAFKGIIWSVIGTAIFAGLYILLLTMLMNKKRKKKMPTKASSKNKPKVKSKKKKKKKKKLLKIILIFLFTTFILVAAVSAMFLYHIVSTAPEFDPDKLYQKEASILYDANGDIIAKLGLEKRENITYEQLPEVLVDAIIATEDSRFFQHNGFDLPRFLKASFGQVLGNSGAGGASTLTMQVVKNHFTSTNASGFEGIKRKFTDIYMAIFKVEKEYSKQQIIEFYVNSNYLGGGAHGVEQACLTYFGKSAKDINLSEAAIIAGLFQSPGAYDPFVNPELTEKRRNVVLSLMVRHGYITQEEKDIAVEIPVESLLATSEKTNNKYQGFINTVVEEVEKLTDSSPYSVPMEIYTTMDPDKQEYLYTIMSGEDYEWENDLVDAGISVIDVDTGAIVAIGTGRDTDLQRGFNHATMISRQIGSSAKPLYDYAPGIEYNAWSTYHPFIDEAHSYSGSTSNVNNWDNKYRGFYTLRNALIQSRNIPALKAFQSLDNKDVKGFVTSLGLNPELESGNVHEAHAIGGYNGESPLTMSAAYASFANGGFYTEPYSFTKIVFKDSGDEFDNKKTKERVMQESTAYMVADMLVDAKEVNMGGYRNINGQVFGAKTGTTNYTAADFEKYDLENGAVNDFWITGFNSNYSIALWYGYDETNSEYTNNINRTSVRAKLYNKIGQGIFTDGTSFKKPNNVIEVAIENESYPAKLPSQYTPKDQIVTELFQKGTEPTEVSDRFAQLENVENISSELQGSLINVSWDSIETPSAIDPDSLTTYFKLLYKSTSDQEKYMAARVAYNNYTFGELGYNIYISENGEQTLIGFTKETSFEIDPILFTTTNPKVVIKSSYSIYKATEATGSEVEVDLSAPLHIQSNLQGGSTINLNIGDIYLEPNPPLIVSEGVTLVTNDATIDKVITNSAGAIVTAIDTSAPETFTMTYSVKYKSYTETFTRTVIVN